MNSPSSLDASAILDRIIAAVTRNLRIEEILLQLGLDPSNLTFETVANRLVDVGLTHITLANMLALTGAIFFVATLMVRTIVLFARYRHHQLRFYRLRCVGRVDGRLFSFICCRCRSTLFGSVKR